MTLRALIETAEPGYDHEIYEYATERVYDQDTARGTEQWTYYTMEFDDLEDILDRVGPSVLINRNHKYPHRDQLEIDIDFELVIYDDAVDYDNLEELTTNDTE